MQSEFILRTIHSKLYLKKNFLYNRSICYFYETVAKVTIEVSTLNLDSEKQSNDAKCHILRCTNVKVNPGCKILFAQPSEFSTVSEVASALADGNGLKLADWRGILLQDSENKTVSIELPAYVVNVWMAAA